MAYNFTTNKWDADPAPPKITSPMYLPKTTPAPVATTPAPTTQPSVVNPFVVSKTPTANFAPTAPLVSRSRSATPTAPTATVTPTAPTSTVTPTAPTAPYVDNTSELSRAYGVYNKNVAEKAPTDLQDKYIKSLLSQMTVAQKDNFYRINPVMAALELTRAKDVYDREASADPNFYNTDRAKEIKNWGDTVRGYAGNNIDPKQFGSGVTASDARANMGSLFEASPTMKSIKTSYTDASNMKDVVSMYRQAIKADEARVQVGLPSQNSQLITRLKGIIDTTPPAALEHDVEGMQLYKKGNYIGAIQAFSEANLNREEKGLAPENIDLIKNLNGLINNQRAINALQTYQSTVNARNSIYNKMDALTNAPIVAAPIIGSEEAMAKAGQILNPRFDQAKEADIRRLNYNAIQRGFFGQLPAEALMASTMAQDNANRQGAISAEAQNYINQSRADSQVGYQQKVSERETALNAFKTMLNEKNIDVNAANAEALFGAELTKANMGNDMGAIDLQVKKDTKDTFVQQELDKGKLSTAQVKLIESTLGYTIDEAKQKSLQSVLTTAGMKLDNEGKLIDNDGKELGLDQMAETIKNLIATGKNIEADTLYRIAQSQQAKTQAKLIDAQAELVGKEVENYNETEEGKRILMRAQAALIGKEVENYNETEEAKRILIRAQTAAANKSNTGGGGSGKSNNMTSSEMTIYEKAYIAQQKNTYANDLDAIAKGVARQRDLDIKNGVTGEDGNLLPALSVNHAKAVVLQKQPGNSDGYVVAYLDENGVTKYINGRAALKKTLVTGNDVTGIGAYGDEDAELVMNINFVDNYKNR